MQQPQQAAQLPIDRHTTDNSLALILCSYVQKCASNAIGAAQLPKLLHMCRAVHEKCMPPNSNACLCIHDSAVTLQSRWTNFMWAMEGQDPVQVSAGDITRTGMRSTPNTVPATNQQASSCGLGSVCASCLHQATVLATSFATEMHHHSLPTGCQPVALVAVCTARGAWCPRTSVHEHL